jgi:hypothetical protein
MRLIFATLSLATLVSASEASAQEPMIDCIAQFRTTTMTTEAAPGSLRVWKDRPCKTSIHTSGIGARAPGQLKGIRFEERPRFAKVSVKSKASFVILPNKGFSGQDTMVVRILHGGGKSSLVRFAITVS